MNNKKGWIRIVEAFISVLVVAGVLLTLVNTGMIGKDDISEKVYEAQVAVLREIELNKDLRAEVLNLLNDDLPIEWEEFENKSLLGIKEKINTKMPEYLDCTARICKLDDVCALQTYKEGDVYAQAVAIVANVEYYAPRQIKLFCMTR